MVGIAPKLVVVSYAQYAVGFTVCKIGKYHLTQIMPGPGNSVRFIGLL
jgi:hypothetical protein